MCMQVHVDPSRMSWCGEHMILEVFGDQCGVCVHGLKYPVHPLKESYKDEQNT